jgi:serine protease Do
MNTVRQHSTSLALFSSGVALAIAVLTVVLPFRSPAGEMPAQERPLTLDEQAKLREELRGLPDPSQAYVKVSKLAMPSVVHIAVSKTVRLPDDWDDFFEQPFFKRFGGERPPRRYEQQAMGSGFIIESDGLILTNNHVVDAAEKVVVRLHDGREFTGKVLGTDPVTDVALVRIDAKGLPTIVLGDSDRIEVGASAIAIGNPFGLDGTVTVGVVSAKGRTHLGILDHEDFIQTDAAINPGNSGGPLMNVRGEVVGVNAVIFSRSGGYQGIGFAIPINMAKRVKEKILKTGRVIRGTLGVRMTDPDPETRKREGVSGGSYIAKVFPASPAEDAGLQAEDLVVTFDGKEIRDSRHLRWLIAEEEVGKTARLGLLRHGKRLDLEVQIREWKPEF